MANQQQTPYTSRQFTGTLANSGQMFNPALGTQGVGAGIGAAGGKTYNRQVQGNELVSQQLMQLLNSQNPYIQQADQSGREVAAARGGLNSSLYAGAARRAAIEAGLPIAQADALAHQAAATQNMSALTDATMQERDIGNQLLMEDKRLGQAASQHAQAMANAAAERQLRLQMQREGLAYEGEQNELGRAHDIVLSNLGYGQELGRMSADYNFRDQLMRNETMWADWLNDQQFSNEMYSQLALRPVTQATDFFFGMMELAAQNPAGYNPQDVGNLTGFMTEFLPEFLTELMGGLGVGG